MAKVSLRLNTLQKPSKSSLLNVSKLLTLLSPSRVSYEVGRDCPHLGAVKQARTLRLLANAFLDLDGDGLWQKALNAVSLANSEHSHPAGFLLKTSILLQHDSGNERLTQCKA